MYVNSVKTGEGLMTCSGLETKYHLKKKKKSVMTPELMLKPFGTRRLVVLIECIVTSFIQQTFISIIQET